MINALALIEASIDFGEEEQIEDEALIQGILLLAN